MVEAILVQIKKKSSFLFVCDYPTPRIFGADHRCGGAERVNGIEKKMGSLG
jgi:hypothetical protein